MLQGRVPSINLTDVCCLLCMLVCYGLQMQRQLQHSLEVHQRYIHSLMEQEGLAHKIPEMSAALGTGAAAAAPPASVVSEAMPVQPLPPSSNAASKSPHHRQQQQQGGHTGAAATASAATAGHHHHSEQQQGLSKPLPQQPQGHTRDSVAAAAAADQFLSDAELLMGFPDLQHDTGDLDPIQQRLLGDEEEQQPPDKRQRMAAHGAL